MRVLLLCCLLAATVATCTRRPYTPDVYTSASPEGRQPHGVADGQGGPPDSSGDIPETGTLPGIAAPIAIDGEFDDWEAVPEAVRDPDDDHTGDIDLRVVKLANDQHYLYLYLEVGAPISLANDNRLTLYLDSDGNALTGQPFDALGAELRWVFGQRTGRFYSPGDSAMIYFSDIRLRAAPAVTSTRFEVALGRQEKPVHGHPLFPGSKIRLKVVDHQWDDTVADATGTLTYEFAPHPVEEPPAPEVRRPAAGGIRIVSWNTLYTGLLDEPRQEAFRRVLQALQPDVLCLQEAWYPAETVALIRQWLPQADGDWEVRSVQNQITVSRLPFVAGVPGGYGLLTDNFLVTAVTVNAEQQLVVFNGHMAFGDNDEDRQAQADNWVAYVRQMQAAKGFPAVAPQTPFLLAGDLNLVGDAAQLTTLLEGTIADTGNYGPGGPPDWDGTPLTAALPWQTGNRMAWTWRYDEGSYWPGRLDYVIYSDSVVQVQQVFVLNTAQMSQARLGDLGLYETDTAVASDHLPVVVDLAL